MIYGFGEGWHEAEYDNATGVSWRWTSGRSVLRVSPPRRRHPHAGGVAAEVFQGSADSKDQGRRPIVEELRPDADFEWAVKVSADAIRNGEGAIEIETDRIYLPGQVEGTSDARQLGLRLYEITVNPVTP